MQSYDPDFEAWRKKLRKLSHDLLGPVSSRADTSDIVQNVSQQILGQGGEIGAVNEGYLAVAARGHAAKIMRFHLRECRSIARETPLLEPPSPVLSPDQILQRREAYAQLANAVAKLDDDEQRIVYLRIHRSMSFREIAEETNSTERAVKWAFDKIIVRLRMLLGGEEIE